jgi:hypothetical protein
MIFKLYDCDFGVTLGGVNYDFEHIENLQIEDPERTKLIRGGNAGNKTGLIYKEGIKEPKTITLTVIGMPMELHNLLKQAYTASLAWMAPLRLQRMRFFLRSLSNSRLMTPLKACIPRSSLNPLT